MFIGFYSTANAVTLFGLLSSVMACFLAANGDYKFAVLLLGIACICDTVDGRIARSKGYRTPQQKCYGIQLDSICDMVSFGVTPCFIAFSLGFKGVLDVIIYMIFIACGAIRLSYFNTLALDNTAKPVKTYRGVPITVSGFFTTLLVLLTAFIPADICVWIFRLVLLVLACLFVLNIRIKKPPMKTMAIIAGAQIILLIILFIAGDLKLPA